MIKKVETVKMFNTNWLGLVDKVKTKLLSLKRNIFIPELGFLD